MNARATLIYAGLGGLVGVLTEVLQLAIDVSTHPITEPSRWAISAGAGILAAGVGAALPWIKTALPTTPPLPGSPSDTTIKKS